ncbi:GNAT family N-acetyltransferase [Oceanicoccus sp. KOV_DT_Chl]|uniref:GNAT family N-acetyltransferase n=1 Tax=Oceanicoccus sp. KOV_DT_Chl TaxID=1904639 RepID=UPI000C7AE6D7|nr:GNAT family N-acetyltransferase [Oceanicoccus sp. KOV_DT_Chl]
MIQIIEPTTERLQLRQWTGSDRDPFAVMSADPQVMEFFPGTLNKSESDAIAETCENLIAERGWGVWAVELLQTGEFIGFVGLHIPRADLPPSPCVEVLWRLAPSHWGYGYATEAATAALKVAFEQLNLKEVVSFAVPANLRSRRVMARLGMADTGETFEHPDVPESSHLREHCWYIISREMWAHNVV